LPIGIWQLDYLLERATTTTMKLTVADLLLGGLVFLSHGGTVLAEQLTDSAFARIMMARELNPVDEVSTMMQPAVLVFLPFFTLTH
jgi:hypothetical protein